MYTKVQLEPNVSLKNVCLVDIKLSSFLTIFSSQWDISTRQLHITTFELDFLVSKLIFDDMASTGLELQVCPPNYQANPAP